MIRDRYLTPRLEWRTLLLGVVIYGGWMALTWFHAHIPWPVLALAGGWLIAWHGSLQHEAIHGHPTRSATFNRAFAFAPLALWLPYDIYHRTHLAHHLTDKVTDPLEDPESRYLLNDVGWRGMLGRLQATLLGRLVFGPLIVIGTFLADEAQRGWRAPRQVARDWQPHVIGVAAILLWLDAVGLHPGVYLLAFVYPGTALSLLRSFAEHRADSDPRRRAATVERAGVFGLLFLNNNLHVAHHARPALPWYALPAYHARHRAHFAAVNGNLVYSGYGSILRRFAFRRHDVIVHPDHRGVDHG